MSFSIVADIPQEKSLKLVNRYFPFNDENVLDDSNFKTMYEAKDIVEREKIISKKTHQSHCVIGSRAYTLYEKERLPLSLLANVLGGPALNSRLNLVLREKYGLAYTVDATYTPYMDTGLFTVYFGTDKNNVERCLDLVKKEFSILTDSEISAFQLKAAKKQLYGQLAISMDNAESQCLSMGKSLLVYGRVESIESIMERIEQITPKQLNDVANEIFSSDKLYTLIYK